MTLASDPVSIGPGAIAPSRARIIRGAFLFLLLWAWASGTAHAARVALVIANSLYANASPLANPANDAKLVADSARRAGFDTVTLATDVNVGDFRRTLRDFRSKASGADIAMVYYAGHGIESAGKNWLIPVDAGLNSNLDLAYEAIDLDLVMEAISGARVRMVVLDACRNNPFGRSWRSGTRAVTRGLANVDVDDVLVIFAAAPGQTAADGVGANSPFAASFAKRLPQPDLPIQLLGGLVRDDVLAATAGEQRPFVSASITGTPVYLSGRAGAGAAASGPPPSAPSASSASRGRPAGTALEPGQWILAKADDGFWYPGIIEKAGAAFDLVLDSGDRISRAPTDVKLYDWRADTKLSCRWSGDDQFYGATILRVDEGERLAIRFDDGVEEQASTGRCRSR